MKTDFSDVRNAEERSSVPAGTYLCRVREARRRQARTSGAEQFAVALEVVEGDFAGRLAAWDNLTFSERGLPRVKHALRAFGFDVSGVVDVEARELEGREVRVELIEDPYVDPATGQATVSVRVAFLGYSPPSGDGERTVHGFGDDPDLAAEPSPF